jgi:hypothetical protein
MRLTRGDSGRRLLRAVLVRDDAPLDVELRPFVLLLDLAAGFCVEVLLEFWP